MNDRIRQLAEQAGLVSKQIGPGVETRYTKKKEQALEDFAESIVKQCINRIELQNKMDEVTEQWVYKNIVDDLKDHFGVNR